MKTPTHSSNRFSSPPASLAAGCLFLTLSVAASCGSDFVPVTELDKLRVLALRADPPWLDPGQSTELTALVYTPTGEAVSYTWSWCPFTTSAVDNYACAIERAEVQAIVDAQLPPAQRFIVPDYELASASVSELLHTMPAQYLQELCQAMLAEKAPKFSILPDCSQSFPVTVKLVAASAIEQVTAVKMVRFKYDSTDPDNANPWLGDLFASPDEGGSDRQTFPEGGTLTLARKTDYWLRLELPVAAAESYADVDGSATDERLVVSWFVEAGDLDSVRSLAEPADDALAATNLIEVPETEIYQPNDVDFYLVVRDDRGGTGWMMRTAGLEVQP